MCLKTAGNFSVVLIIQSIMIVTFFVRYTLFVWFALIAVCKQVEDTLSCPRILSTPGASHKFSSRSLQMRPR